jgi:hypothetical protein
MIKFSTDYPDDNDRAFAHRTQLGEQVYFPACSSAAKTWRYATLNTQSFLVDTDAYGF